MVLGCFFRVLWGLGFGLGFEVRVGGRGFRVRCGGGGWGLVVRGLGVGLGFWGAGWVVRGSLFISKICS